jgi:cyclic pyranopterin phosphate synthase
MSLIRRIVEIPGIRDLHLTTNGVLTAPHIPELKKLGIASVNLSLDTLDKERFEAITRRDTFNAVINTFHSLLEHEIPVKINAVVMDGKNVDDIIPLIELTKHSPVSVRFIEEMPFNGEGNHYPTLLWTYGKILSYITSHYQDVIKIPDPANSTSYNYQIPGYKGTIGIIAAFTRSFCGTCNRIRVTAQGGLKTCLYDDGVINIKDLMRDGTTDEKIKYELLKVFKTRPKDGFEAEGKRNNHLPAHESMSTIGG